MNPDNRNETVIRHFATGEVRNPDGSLAVAADPTPPEFDFTKEDSND